MNATSLEDLVKRFSSHPDQDHKELPEKCNAYVECGTKDKNPSLVRANLKDLVDKFGQKEQFISRDIPDKCANVTEQESNISQNFQPVEENTTEDNTATAAKIALALPIFNEVQKKQLIKLMEAKIIMDKTSFESLRDIYRTVENFMTIINQKPLKEFVKYYYLSSFEKAIIACDCVDDERAGKDSLVMRCTTLFNVKFVEDARATSAKITTWPKKMIVDADPQLSVARMLQESENYLLQAKKTLSRKVIVFIKDQILVRIFDQESEIMPYYLHRENLRGKHEQPSEQSEDDEEAASTSTPLPEEEKNKEDEEDDEDEEDAHKSKKRKGNGGDDYLAEDTIEEAARYGGICDPLEFGGVMDDTFSAALHNITHMEVAPCGHFCSLPGLFSLSFQQKSISELCLQARRNEADRPKHICCVIGQQVYMELLHSIALGVAGLNNLKTFTLLVPEYYAGRNMNKFITKVNRIVNGETKPVEWLCHMDTDVFKIDYGDEGISRHVAIFRHGVRSSVREITDSMSLRIENAYKTCRRLFTDSVCGSHGLKLQPIKKIVARMGVVQNDIVWEIGSGTNCFAAALSAATLNTVLCTDIGKVIHYYQNICKITPGNTMSNQEVLQEALSKLDSDQLDDMVQSKFTDSTAAYEGMHDLMIAALLKINQQQSKQKTPTASATTKPDTTHKQKQQQAKNMPAKNMPAPAATLNPAETLDQQNPIAENSKIERKSHRIYVSDDEDEEEEEEDTQNNLLLNRITIMLHEGADFYSLLNTVNENELVDENSIPAKIRSTYLKLTRCVHPDRNIDCQDLANFVSQEINSYYEAYKDVHE